MKWICCISVLVLVPFISVGQARFDANWCFGNGAGIDFSDTANIRTFRQSGMTFETCASFSNFLGKLLFFLQADYSQPTQNPMLLVDSLGNTLQGGDSINVGISATNGALFLPRSQNVITLFHLGYYDFFTCQACYTLMRTEILVDSTGMGVVSKNQGMGLSDIEEKIAAVRHANGNDWWIYLHGVFRGLNGLCTDTFYRYLITPDAILGPFIQQVGRPSCENYGFAGEMVVSDNGSRMARVSFGDDILEIFSIDRCTGLLTSVYTDTIIAYSCEFSPDGKMLYVVQSLDSLAVVSEDRSLVQYDFSVSDVSPTKTTLFTTIDQQIYLAQLEAGGGKCFLTAVSFISQNDSPNRSLSVINSPNSSGVACSFQPFSLSLADSSYTDYGLPNMPNYNLGPIGIYKAGAGRDTVLCPGNSGLRLGTPPLAKLVYRWEPAST
ncbi:MAG: hypothetical protein SFW35_12765, partial [Chitinophagales bacterium]|nr:hypothetical protein [Chitinophagales bacterium]